MRDHIVIGLGTGRCGTKTLSRILGFTHEGRHLPWIYCEPLFQNALSFVREHRGDVGCYWLNYVEPLLQAHPDTKFVCLQRDKESTVKSWRRRMVGRKEFGIYVMYVDPTGRIRAPSMFPDYKGVALDRAAALYWETYYEKARKLEELYPSAFRIYPMDEVLNDKRVQRKMLKFAGMTNAPRVKKRENRGGMHDSEFGNMMADISAEMIEKYDLRPGARMCIKPPLGSRLGELAVKRGVSKSVTEPIMLEFNKGLIK